MIKQVYVKAVQNPYQCHTSVINMQIISCISIFYVVYLHGAWCMDTAEMAQYTLYKNKNTTEFLENYYETEYVIKSDLICKVGYKSF